MTHLLAKSRRAGRELTLSQHLQDTAAAASLLFRAGTRWAATFLRFFGLCDEDHARFLLHLRVAALFHDIGKANDGFLTAVTKPGFTTQPFRHEHLSALVIAHPDVRAWLQAAPHLDIDLLVAAVLSHHLKAGRDGDYRFMQTATAAPTRLFFDDGQVHQTWGRIAEAIVAPLPKFRLPTSYADDDAGWNAAWDWFDDHANRRFPRDLRSPSGGRRLALCMALKAAVIAADSVASAAFREELSIEAWIDEVAHRQAIQPTSIADDILLPRQREIEQTRPFKPHRFQDGAATLGPRALLLAGCGMGKTLAAWRWADALVRERPIGRVIFLYPTRGTATEGFRDYVGHAPEGSAALVHGTARYELQGMLENPPTSLRNKSVVADEGEARLFALGLWSKRYFSATVDQFLSFIEHGYGGMCLLPALADSAVVFDEVHSYDARMWNALVTFLQRFHVPALCMTATLPPSRKAELAKLLRVYPDDIERAQLSDLERAESHPRYRFEGVADEDAAFVRAVAAREQGQRVLWVVNTVRRCQRLVRRLRAVVPGVLAYHSRFKLDDRQARHRAAVDAFRAPEHGDPVPAIAVTTQVCEMSLDLDADVLITEHAPVSSLVQRFGRANRHLRRGDAFRASLLTYAPETRLPYDKEELDAATRFLIAFDRREASQRDLADGLTAHAPPARAAEGQTRFTDGGFFATPGALRETDDAGSPVILDADVTRFRKLVAARKPTDGLRLTVPKKFAREHEQPGLPGWLRLADASRYSPSLGFEVEEEAT